MMLRRAVNLSIAGRKLISTTSDKCTVQAADALKREDYYKKLAEKDVDTIPKGWDEALPFDSIPGPKALPLIGSIWKFLPYIGEFHNIPFRKLHETLHEKYGNIVKMHSFPGTPPIVLIYDTKDMEHLFRSIGPFPIRDGLHALVYYRTKTRKDIFKGVGGLITVHGEEWFKFRTIVNPILMQPKIIKQYVEKMDQVAGELVDNMRYFSTLNENKEMPEDFINEIYKWGLESVGVVAIDKHFGCLNLNLKKGSEADKLISSTNEWFDLMFAFEIQPPIWKLISTPSWRRFVKVLDYITETVRVHIDEALSKPIDENIPDEQLSVIHRLAKHDKLVAFTMAFDMILAGIDTTGKSLGGALYYLAKNPEKQDLLREELLKNLPEKNSVITEKMLSKSSYLKAVVKETTRLAPIAVGNSRTTIRDLVLAGHRIPKNTRILTANLVAASNPDEYKDPEKFIPERWLRTTEGEYSHKNANPFAFLPFGFGPRSCIGKRIATMELEVGVAKIIRNFKLSWPHEDMEFSSKLTYGVAKPLKLRLEPVEK